ncbi:hypothetical protein [Pelagicoccus sp. SDUM812003]|uniref:hypothetical protein n=1 Tax=Pelagicoccus sp. SDUM812003 TaxID=3041267 RepID=UPI00280D423E|nr:hypothetical protein [Pelagicoccus sp. SDUM812003]MDQ8202781.1 hypothetical protein [Pelagicoccus sp. SDUM812003]
MDNEDKELLRSISISMLRIENALDAILMMMASKSQEDSYVKISQKGYSSFCGHLKAASFARGFQMAEEQELLLQEYERLPEKVDMTGDFWDGADREPNEERTFGDFVKQLSVKYGFPKGNRNLNTKVRKIILEASLSGELKTTGQIVKYLKTEGFREANRVILDRYSANLIYMHFYKSGALDKGIS